MRADDDGRLPTRWRAPASALAGLLALGAAAEASAQARGFSVTPVTGFYDIVVQADCQQFTGPMRSVIRSGNEPPGATATFFKTPLVRCSSGTTTATALYQAEAKGQNAPARNGSPGFKITLDNSAQVWRQAQGTGFASSLRQSGVDARYWASSTQWRVLNSGARAIGVAVEVEFDVKAATYLNVVSISLEGDSDIHWFGARYENSPSGISSNVGNPAYVCVGPGQSFKVGLGGSAFAEFRSLGPGDYTNGWSHASITLSDVAPAENCTGVSGPFTNSGPGSNVPILR